MFHYFITYAVLEKFMYFVWEPYAMKECDAELDYK